ncbi:hypothetical protein N658DRAFT_487500 [Parathielavia hyrcaniae]|uniref:DUF7730 domain-containing protein n=1 Tax=Parathielavia hyrcaniae TaxID=113614 RepID=A0AAN6PXD9_9PEZI|nr:hypothetical protein N658DRAFT_487500 [Parathielavia hyrcaniae]
MARFTADTSTFTQSADPQLSSPFFTVLPAEIRNLIYGEFWKLCSTRQHIVLKQEGDPELGQSVRKWSHVPCITDPEAEDTRFTRFLACDAASPERTLWGIRLKSEWCLHWQCGEQMRQAPVIPDDVVDQDASSSQPSLETGHLNLLTVCKRMYLESLPTLYASTTFIFTDTREAGDFLSLYGNGGDDDESERYPIRSLELSIRVPNIITEIYYPPAAGSNGDEGPPAVFAGRARPTLSMQHNRWQALCDRLADLPGLQDLRIWFDSSDLRPWHKRVSETRFFGRLFDVRVPDRRRFVLGLPELPERRGPDAQVLQDHYLEGGKLDKAPFTLERGPRPNNWRVHLRSIVSAGATAQSVAVMNVNGP